MEVLVVMAILVLMAVLVLPSVMAFRGDSRPRAGADVIRAELAAARSRAMEEGVPYRVALSQDKKKIRRGPDTSDFATAAAFNQASPEAKVVEYTFDEGTTAEVLADGETEKPETTNNYVTIAVVLPDGTCRADNVIVAVTDEDKQTIHVRVRGITGASRVVPTNSHNGGTR